MHCRVTCRVLCVQDTADTIHELTNARCRLFLIPVANLHDPLFNVWTFCATDGSVAEMVSLRRFPRMNCWTCSRAPPFITQSMLYLVNNTIHRHPKAE